MYSIFTGLSRRKVLGLGVAAAATALISFTAQAADVELRYGHNNEPAWARPPEAISK